MNQILVIIISLLLFFASLFIGSFFMSELPRDHWARFPTLMSMVVIIIASFCLFLYGLYQSDQL
jgi:heme/copper-type cytochrome/quinol oxidase subunit 3